MQFSILLSHSLLKSVHPLALAHFQSSKLPTQCTVSRFRHLAINKHFPQLKSRHKRSFPSDLQQQRLTIAGSSTLSETHVHTVHFLLRPNLCTHLFCQLCLMKRFPSQCACVLNSLARLSHLHNEGDSHGGDLFLYMHNVLTYCWNNRLSNAMYHPTLLRWRYGI